MNDPAWTNEAPAMRYDRFEVLSFDCYGPLAG